MSIGTLLFIAQRAFEEDIVADLRQRGYKFTMAQARLGARIADQGSRLTDLASAAGITKQSASHLITHLEASGNVARKPDPSDARAQLFVLTESGLAMQREARHAEQLIEARWKQLVGADELQAMKTTLQRLRTHVDRHQPKDD